MLEQGYQANNRFDHVTMMEKLLPQTYSMVLTNPGIPHLELPGPWNQRDFEGSLLPFYYLSSENILFKVCTEEKVFKKGGNLIIQILMGSVV